MKFTRVYLIGGDAGKADNTDYIVGYRAENGMYIDIKELIDNSYRWYMVGGKEFATLKEAKEYCEGRANTKKYFEVDKGRFDSMLVRYEYPRPVAVASTCGDAARLEPGYKMADRKAVMDFCEQYDLRIPGLDWWDNEERKA